MRSAPSCISFMISVLRRCREIAGFSCLFLVVLFLLRVLQVSNKLFCFTEQTIKVGDSLLNRIQKLSRVITI